MKVRISAFHLLSYWVYFIFCRSSQVSETVVFCRWWAVVSSHTRLSPGYKTASFGQQQQLGSPVTTTRLITSETLALGVLHISEHKQKTHSTHLFYCQTWCAYGYGNLTAEAPLMLMPPPPHTPTLAWGTIYAIKTQLFNGIFLILEYKVLSSGHHCIISPI